MGYELIMETKDGSDRRFDVREGRTVIGRSDRCDVRITLPSVSANHCEIMLENQQARLVNLDEILGTLLNGKPIQQAQLSPDDRLQVGPVVFRVLKTSDEKAAATNQD